MVDSRLIVEGIDAEGRKMRIYHVVSRFSNEYVLFRERIIKRRGVDYRKGVEVARASTQNEICEKVIAWGFRRL